VGDGMKGYTTHINKYVCLPSLSSKCVSWYVLWCKKGWNMHK
jgi:hypothetical protein